ncbi:glycosyltransferase [Polaribacter sp. BAL334]|uniref:glycosyltransferase n=1 Tax=Polaribacter sp. BAL334 TaxID=1708178 RepID=UPI0018D21098|nr:glycosyltransferase [Polaribacter sp. BAL334]MBG7611673.1 glycosyltransferase [Polaribacter sp. BAL334]
MSKKSLLIIGTVWVAPNASAAGSRMLQLITVFQQQNFQITFVCAAKKVAPFFSLASLGIEEVEIQLNDASFDDFVRKLNPEMILFDRFLTEEQFGWRVFENCPNAMTILDTEDLHCLRKTREICLQKNKDFSIDELKKQEITKREIASILRCDVSLIISTFEMEILTSVFKVEAAILYYLPFLLDKIEDSKVNKWLSFEERNHFVFIGNFFHKPNIDAVQTLKNHIWKNIRKQLPKAELHIYGAFLTVQIQQLHNPKEGFFIKGFAENAEEIITNAKIVLAPLRFGAGIKGKLTEAMLCGTPSITSTIGAEGMHQNLPWNGFITDDFEEFANKAVELYTNQIVWDSAQKNGIEIINAFYDKTKLEPPFINRILEIQQDLENHRSEHFLQSLLQYQTLQATKYLSKWIEAKKG